jgi:hypothetical protein
MLTKLKKIFTTNNFVTIFSQVFQQQQVKDAYLDIILKRIYNDGTDADNKKLKTDRGRPLYAIRTQRIKSKKGQKYSNVTLKDTGQFYDSFVIRTQNKMFEVIAKYQKKDGNIYDNFQKLYSSFEQFDKAITGMQEDEWKLFLDNVIQPKFLQILKNSV